MTFTPDTDHPPAPPAGVMPNSVMIGNLSGISVTHAAQYVVTAAFNISSDQKVALTVPRLRSALEVHAKGTLEKVA